MEAVVDANEIATLNAKLDYLTGLLEEQRRSQAVWQELWHDAVPIMNDMFKLTINELAEVGDDFQLEDLMRLVKRLLRDTKLLVNMLDQLESIADLSGDLSRMVTPTFSTLVEKLHELEQKGYFSFATSSLYIVDQIVTQFTEEDVKALGDNIVTILTTVRNMTQPEIMDLANRAFESMEQPIDHDVSTWQLLREMRDPNVRKGFARMLQMVKALSVDPTGTHN